MEDYGDFYDYHQDESDTAEMWEENQVFLDREGRDDWEDEEDEEDLEDDCDEAVEARAQREFNDFFGREDTLLDSTFEGRYELGD